MKRRFVMGDIHGAYRALKQCLLRADFNYQVDELICLGDVADGWPDTLLCIEELLKIRNLNYVLGNHDFWALEWMQTGTADDVWLSQGGSATVASYANVVPQPHINFLMDAHRWLVLEEKLFVHAGYQPGLPIESHSLNILLWDRMLVRTALECHHLNIKRKLTDYKEVFVGHTPVSGGKPVNACDLWLMDTGAGWSGCLSMMNLDTYEIFSSDDVPTLYPGVIGRTRK